MSIGTHALFIEKHFGKQFHIFAVPQLYNTIWKRSIIFSRRLRSPTSTNKKRPMASKAWPWGTSVNFPLVVRMSGGGGGSRTPVRKHFLRNFSGRRRFFAFPHHDASRHAAWFGSFICHAGGKAYPGHVHHSGHAQAQLVVLLGWTAAIKQRREQFYCCSLIYKVPVLRMSGTSARYSCPHVPVETSTPPNIDFLNGERRGEETCQAGAAIQEAGVSSLLQRTAQMGRTFAS